MDVITALRDTAPAVLDDEPVAFAYLYGSHARGTPTARSDVDVAVHLVEGVEVDGLELALRVSRELERAGGIGPLDVVVVLDDAPLPLAGRIQEQGLVIYSRDEVARACWASLTARMYHDWKIREERVAQERLRAIAAGSA